MYLNALAYNRAASTPSVLAIWVNVELVVQNSEK